MLDDIRSELPEMPDVRKKRFSEELGLPEDDARILTEDRYLADYFEEILDKINEPKEVANVVLTEVLRVLNEASIGIKDFAISAKRLAKLIILKNSDKISSSAMQKIFNEMLESEKPADEIAEDNNLMQVSDSSFLEPIVDEVIADNPDEVERYRNGKKGLIGFFIGQVMKKSKGQANPKMARELVQEKLEG